MDTTTPQSEPVVPQPKGKSALPPRPPKKRAGKGHQVLKDFMFDPPGSKAKCEMVKGMELKRTRHFPEYVAQLVKDGFLSQ